MNNRIKLAIIAGLIVILVWSLYITFIYLDNSQEPMVIKEKCIEYYNASTKTCNNYFPEVYTSFGWMG